MLFLLQLYQYNNYITNTMEQLFTEERFGLKLTSLSSAMTTVSRRLNIQCIKFKIRAFFITTLFARLYMMVGILLTCIKHLHDHNISLRGEGQEHKTSLTLPLFIEVPVPSQESEQSCICVLGEYILPHVAIVLLDFGTVPSAWYIVFFIWSFK